jgi:hypothetical protein
LARAQTNGTVSPLRPLGRNVAIEWKGTLRFDRLSTDVARGSNWDGGGANGWCQYRAFFVWLVQTVAKLDSDDQSPPASSSAAAAPPDVMAVAQFLTHQLSSDRLAPHLAQAAATQTPVGPPEPRTPARGGGGGEGGGGAGEGATTGVTVGVGGEEGSSLEAVLAFVAHAESSDKDAPAPAADGWCLRPEVTPHPATLFPR